MGEGFSALSMHPAEDTRLRVTYLCSFRQLEKVVIRHHLNSDALARKLYNCGSGRDLLLIAHIHLTVRCKFGVALLFGSGEKNNLNALFN